MQMKVQRRCLSRHLVVGVTGGGGLLRTDTPIYQEKTSLARVGPWAWWLEEDPLGPLGIGLGTFLIYS